MRRHFTSLRPCPHPPTRVESKVIRPRDRSRLDRTYLGWSVRLALSRKKLPPAHIFNVRLGFTSTVRLGGLAPSYGVLCLAGFFSFMLLPVTLGLACEVTGSAEASSAGLWFAANAFTVLFVLGMLGSLSPPPCTGSYGICLAL